MKNKKKIFHLSENEISGGSAFYANRLFKFFKKKKYISKLFVLKKTSKDADTIKINSLANNNLRKKLYFLMLSEKNKYSFYNYGKYSINKVSQIKLLMDHKPDAIIVYNNSNLISPNLINYISNNGVKIFFYMMDLEFITGGCHYTFGCENYKINCNNCPATKFLIKNLPNKVFIEKKKNYKHSKIIFLSPNFEIYNKVFKSKIFNKKNHKNFKLNLGIDINLYKPKKINKSKKLKICFRSSLNPRKGNLLLKKSINKLIDGNKYIYKKIHFNILGDSSIISFLKEKKIKFKFYKNVSNEKSLIKFYNDSDIFLNQSIQDAGPIMINEAMSCGLPVISFRTGIAKDILGKNNGFLIDKLNYKSLAKNISKVTKMKKKELFQMKKAARQTAIKHFDINKNLEFILGKI